MKVWPSVGVKVVDSHGHDTFTGDRNFTHCGCFLWTPLRGGFGTESSVVS